MKRSGLTWFICLLLSWSLGSQPLQVYTGEKLPGQLEQAIRQFLLGGGVEILSIRYEGDPRAFALYSDPQSSLGFTQGMILSTGLVDSLTQPNRSGNLSTSTSGLRYQADGLKALVEALDSSDQLLFDVAKLIIRFRPASRLISFRYLFASEEYPQFTCSNFNDVFGFFLTGPKPEGGVYDNENLALVPGTNTIVSVNTIHQGNPIKPDCQAVNPQYYHDNTGGNSLAYNAYLDPFTASAAVIPCAEYEIELSIADLADDNFDTGVFIEANSFESTPYRFAGDVFPSSLILQEGCNDLVIQLDWLDTLTPIHFAVAGTQGDKEDLYVRESIRKDPAGSSIQYQLIPLPDGLTEGEEEVYFILTYGACGADTIRLILLDEFTPPGAMPYDTVVCQGTVLNYFGNTNGASRTLYRGSRGPVFPGINDFTVEVPYFAAPYFDLKWIQSVCLAVEGNEASQWEVFITSPGGIRIPLIQSSEGPQGWTGVCFDWNGNTAWQAAVPPFTENYRPDQLPAYQIPYSGTMAGIWHLTINNIGQTQGQLRDWNMSLEDPVQETWDWLRDGTLTCTNCQFMQTNPDTSANYTLIRSNALRCQDVQQMHVNVLPTRLTGNDIQCINKGDSLVFTWPYVRDYSYTISTDGSNWQSPNRTPFRQVFNENIGLVDSLFLRIQGTCLDTIIAHACEALRCDAGPVIDSPRDTVLSCFGNLIDEYQVDAVPGNTYWLQGIENTTGVFRHLSAGFYPLVVTGADGCKSEYVFQVVQPDALRATAQIQQEVTCPYANDGRVNLSVIGGTAPFSYAWSNGNNDQNPGDLPFGPNRVVVTDRNGCVLYYTIDLPVPEDLQVEVEEKDIDCAGTKTGEVRVKVHGGNGPFQYTWSHNPFLESPLATNLSPGSYQVTVTDPSGCQVSIMAAVEEPSPLELQWESKAISCPDEAGGDLKVMATGGVAPYIYQWNNGWEGEVLPDIKPGDYCVTVTDAFGCRQVACQRVAPGQSALLESKAIQPSCLLGPLGAIEMQLDPAFAPYAIIWTGGSRYMSNGYGIKNAEPGKYTAFVNDDRGCSFSRTFEINPLDTLLYAITTSDVTCAGYQDGLFMIQVQQSNGSVFFSMDSTHWQTTGLFRDLSDGSYRLFLRDQADCTAEDTVIIQSPDSLRVYLGPDTTIRYGRSLEIVPTIDNAQGVPSVMWTGKEVPADCVDCSLLTLYPEYSTSLKIVVVDEKGCRAEDYLQIAVEDAVLIEVPTAFTPNGDGLNDRFTIHGTPPIRLVEVMVWDRLGNLLYDSRIDELNDTSIGWDGTFRGKEVPAGAYRWLVQAETRPGKSESFSGWIQLLR